MPLPISPLPTGTVDIAGVAAPIRSLSRGERLRLVSFGEEGYRDAEAFVIAVATDTSEDEAAAWVYASAPADVDAILSAIFELSGLARPADESEGEAPGADPTPGSMVEPPSEPPSSEP